MAQFDLTAAMGLRSVSKLDTAVQIIELNLIDPHPDNFFAVEKDITDLAESISLNGLLQPLVVTPSSDGRYRLIAGHRRRTALLKLAETEFSKYRFVSCIVQPPMSPELEMLALIQTNTEAREIDSITRAKAAQAVEEALVKLVKEQGLELPGKMRAHVAKIIKSSEAQIARAKYIAKHLIKPLQKQGLSDSAAYTLAHMPAEQQEELYEHYKTHPFMIDNTRIKSYKDNIAVGRDPFYTEPSHASVTGRDCYLQPRGGYRYAKCDRGDIIKAHQAFSSELPKTNFPSLCNGSCCRYCYNRFFCSDVCPRCAEEIHRDESTDSFFINRRLHDARMAAGISNKEAMELFGFTLDDLLASETTLAMSATTLAARCRAYGCTPNQILGFEEMPGGGDAL